MEKYLFVVCIGNVAMGIFPNMESAKASLALSGTVDYDSRYTQESFCCGNIRLKGNFLHKFSICGNCPIVENEEPHSLFRE